MSQRSSKLAIVIVAAGILILVAWLSRTSFSGSGSDESLVQRIVSAPADKRDDLVIEIGNRGSALIPDVVSAYGKAGGDPVLRIQLATAIFRTHSVKAQPALEGLARSESSPEVRTELDGFVTRLSRMSASDKTP